MARLSCTNWILDSKLSAGNGCSGPLVPDLLKNAIDDGLAVRCRQKLATELQLQDDSKFLEIKAGGIDSYDDPKESKENVEEGTEVCYVDSQGRWSVCHFSMLPKWLQDNDFLLNGHRPPLRSFKACLASMFRVHTETGNIWSHLIGAFMFACTGFGFLSAHPMAFNEQLAFAVFFTCVFICFFTSTLYHTMHCHSMNVSRVFSRLDYCGIISIVAGCFTPWIHFLFWCSPRIKIFYMVLAYTLCTLTVNLTMWEKFGRSHYRLLRAAVFTGLGVSCSILPGIHFVLVHGLRTAFVDLAFGWLFVMSAVAMLGVALYAFRIPERFVPGKFDIMCHSHQFFHIAVIVGAYVHLHCLCQMARFRHGIGAICPADLDEMKVF